MTGSDRLRGNVRILSRRTQEVVGLGFLIDRDHIMTCAHVVASALSTRAAWVGRDAPGPAEQVDVEFLADPSRSAVQASVVAWCAEVAESGRATTPEDIAVLRLMAPGTAPPEAQPVRAAEQVDSDLRVRAYGRKAQVPGGKPIRGEVEEMLEPRRWSFHATEDDLAVDPGCSGAALWAPALGGVVGMICEMQQHNVGLFIPVDVLKEVWPLEDAGDVTSQKGSQAVQQQRPLGERLAEQLYACDRERHETAFLSIIHKSWRTRHDPLVCLYGAIEADLPEVFRERLLQGPLRSQLQGLAKRFDMRKLDWPDRGTLTDRLWYLRLQLASTFRSKGAEPSALCDAYNLGHWPWLFYSELRRSDLDVADITLLRAWQVFLRRFGRHDPNKPLAHLIVVQLDDVEVDPNHDSSETLLASAYEAALAPLAVGQVHRLPPLQRLKADDVSLWISGISNDLALDEATVGRLSSRARDAMPVGVRRRLRDIDAWARQQMGT